MDEPDEGGATGSRDSRAIESPRRTEASPSAESPLRWTHLGELFFRPTRFFRAGLPLGEKGYLYPLLLILGITAASAGIDTNLMRGDLRNPSVGWDVLEPWLLDSWVSYWGFVLLAGIGGAVLIWYVLGWWYHVRIRWSGDPERDKRRARLTMVWSGLVQALPTLIYLVVATAVYSSYREVRSSEEIFSLLLIVFPYWSVLVSYKGVRARFGVGKWRARLWFLILPTLAYLVAFGAVGGLYLMLERA